MTQTLARAFADIQRAGSASIPARLLAAAIAVFFSLSNLLLLAFLGQPPLLVGALALTLPPALGFMVYRMMPGACRIEASTLAISFLAAAILLILGGEGRFFYATADWQIRDAVLADMAVHHWPFDYWLDGRSQMLRAPIGMYMVPALLGGASQLGRDWVLLAQNSLILCILFALGAALFEGRRARLIALIVFIAFSGLDVVGNLIVQAVKGEASWDHIEDWANGYQYSSHITQIFWVPQHAIAGWTVALAYLLWRRGLAPISLFAASLPLVAIWSPLILFGALPFALFAGIRTLLTKAWDWRDLLLCGSAFALVLPALIYLSIDAGAVGGRLRPPNGSIYVLLMLLEVIPFLLPLLRDANERSDRATILISGACLFLMPSWSIGQFNDFQMRASIMPLALMALAFADWASRIDRTRVKICFLAIISLGSITGGIGIANAIRFAPSPAPHCSVAGVWDRQTGLSAPHASYFADRDAFPIKINPVDRASAANPAQCWDRPWRTASGAAGEQQDRP